MPVSISSVYGPRCWYIAFPSPSRHCQGGTGGSRFDLATSAVVLTATPSRSFLFAILLVVVFGGQLLALVPAAPLTSDGAAA